MKTRIIKVQKPRGAEGETAFGRWANSSSTEKDRLKELDIWEVPSETEAAAAAATESILTPLREAGAYLRSSDIPVAFPTETVYGLGADATRSAAVKGIYQAKGRPSDNPLIVHVCDLSMLRGFLQSGPPETETETIPAIYHPLIARFWPGPLTILLPNPSPPLSKLAPEVTAGLSTFGCRMPASPLARTLIALARAPLAAPSANASTKPSPTTAQHVLDDLSGRIELILDGGACAVGVESTVVDGLCDPPVVLRPGGVSMEEIRGCVGWEAVEKAYKDQAETGGNKGTAAPRAPGMKYKHYSPKARVVLYEAGFVGGGGGGGGGGEVLLEEDLETALATTTTAEKGGRTVAVIRTGRWPAAAGLRTSELKTDSQAQELGDNEDVEVNDATFVVREGSLLCSADDTAVARLLDVDLGRDVKGVAHGLFAALRELDRRGANVIFVEGVNDGDDIAAAVMNRLRKAASDIRI
ncbi:DHBP synthase RibB-like alpha/beta domain-containing protein [Bombardia bombarda]|uniref:Threonylcarbamoyl-AMP synthase n=1 Tax=Bombardia bombarda TaxID=252184 RepID=A0AA40BYB9_9PEZI|nr:DHBP synthase RibB-like alpha/beta domain-containing protein [Bombardia bombarda]